MTRLALEHPWGSSHYRTCELGTEFHRRNKNSVLASEPVRQRFESVAALIRAACNSKVGPAYAAYLFSANLQLTFEVKR